MAKNNWSRDELIIAFNLYCKTPFGRIHIRNPEIIALANLIGRTPSSISWKLANFSRLDPSLKKRNILGASHGSKGELEIWEEFYHDWGKLGFESETLLATLQGKSIDDELSIRESELPKVGKEREALVKVRVNQSFFRAVVLASYDFKCCITGISVTELLNASHIKPWALDHQNRVNPSNGLSLNAIHDRAFDRGLLTITTDFTVRLSASLKKNANDDGLKNFLLRYEGQKIKLPSRFMPDRTLIEYHNKHIFKE